MTPTPASVPGIILAAPRSGAGKTTISLGLMRALRDRNLTVQPFKCGPDYIDPAFHSVASGRSSYNIDTWSMRRETIADIISKQTKLAEIVVCEGVMGLFDGVASPGQTAGGATADVAALTGWPVVLVLDVQGQSETAAAIAQGLANYRDDVKVAGVILNRVASPRQLNLIALAFGNIGIPILGTIGRDPELGLEERHLGLVQATEIRSLEDRLDRMATTIAEHVDLDGIIASAAPANTMTNGRDEANRLPPPGHRIALARDAAFSFIYPHMVADWRTAGSEILPFSPLADEAPDMSADAVWLPGGYPELHAASIAAATKFKHALKTHADRGTPIHGECGGYMVLGAGLEEKDGHRHEMAGLLALETSYAKRKLHLGYRSARLRAPSALGQSGTVVYGHEFHYATILSAADEPLADVFDANGQPVSETGSRRGSVTGTFFHAIDRGATHDQ